MTSSIDETKAGGTLDDQFSDPPREYGPVPLWWLDGEDLDPERLTDQLEAVNERGVSSVCFISKYPNGPTGDEQIYFSEEWWACIEHVASECDRLDMALWVHDETYHHSPPTPREYWHDHLRSEVSEHPALRGRVLDRVAVDATGGETVELAVPDDLDPLSIAAYPRDGSDQLHVDEAVTLDDEFDEQADVLSWTAPPKRNWHVAVIGHRPEGLCHTTRVAVERYIDLHLDEYVRRLGADRVENVLAGTFEDELVVLDGEIPCDAHVLARFEDEHGYDAAPLLVALYEDASALTTRLRTDYYDTVTGLLEECWFQPLYEWHDAHNMQRSHDNWGRNDLSGGTEQYGDYFRTMRWYQAPGYDDGGPAAIGDRNFFDAKLAASIAACYDRERVWGELFHSTGWGFEPDDQLAGVVENICYGCTLYDNHGLYYTTLGGWWEHAPGDVHFRQPYWEHVGDLNGAITRLSYLFSRGGPVVDAALAYPTAAFHADWHPDDGIGDSGQAVDAAARDITELLYKSGTDLVLTDPESLADAAATDGQLIVEGMEIPVLILPPMPVIDRETLATVSEFYDAGGFIVAVGRLPTAVAGSADADIDAVLQRVFGETYTAAQDERIEGRHTNENSTGGVGILTGEAANLTTLIDEFVDRDVRTGPDLYHTHRRIGEWDAYLLFNARDEPRIADVRFRAEGRPEQWDPLTGETEAVHEYDCAGGYTTLELSFASHGHQIIAFRTETGADERTPNVTASSLAAVTGVESVDDGIEVQGRTRTNGSMSAQVVHDGETHLIEDAGGSVPELIELNERWEFEPVPVLNNTWGDFRYPPSGDTMRPEIRTFQYRPEQSGTEGLSEGWFRPGTDEDDWETVDWSYGPHFWRRTDSGGSILTPEESPAGWELYDFSMLVGRPGTHPYLNGYISIVSDEFLLSPEGENPTQFWTTIWAPATGTAAIQHGAGIECMELGDRVMEPGIDSRGVSTGTDTFDAGRKIVHLPAGRTDVLLTVSPGTETYFAVEPVNDDARELDMRGVPRVRWFRVDSPYTFDAKPWEEPSIGWYRFEVPAGTASFSLPVRGTLRVWVDGTEQLQPGNRVSLDAPTEESTVVVVRLEHERGAYGGAAWTAPVAIETDPVIVDAGAWEEFGFVNFSGHGRYRTTVALPEFEPDDHVFLNLGDVRVSAAIAVNGIDVGTTFAPPFEVDVTAATESGTNCIEVTVANTLANHFSTETPRRYAHDNPVGRTGKERLPNVVHDDTISGLLGPVTVRTERAITLTSSDDGR